jgi:CDP-diacylglycerol--serine O-phosphatidyltransferase
MSALNPPRLRRPPLEKTLVLFPNGITLGNLFFGVWAIVTASRGAAATDPEVAANLFSRAAYFVFFGAICDAFDGRVARATNSGGRFGEELDSLVDGITFGLAPAMIMYFAVLNRTGLDWIWAFLFTACAVLRLARFNVVQAGTAKNYFQGLPSPAAGLTLASYYWFSQSTLYTDTVVADWPWHQMLRVVMGLLSFLMISNVPYPVVPNLGFKSLRGWIAVIFLVGGTTMLATRRVEYFFPIAFAYASFGLLRAFYLGAIDRLPGDTVDDEEVLPAPRQPRGAGDVSSLHIEGVESPLRRPRKRRRRRGPGGGGDRPDRSNPPEGLNE